MSESIVLTEMQQRIESLAAAGHCNGAMLSLLEESYGYQIIIDSSHGVGIKDTKSGEDVTCYHPKLVMNENETADPP